MLFSGQPLVTSTPLGVLDMIKYDEFVGYLEFVLPKDVSESIVFRQDGFGACLNCLS